MSAHANINATLERCGTADLVSSKSRSASIWRESRSSHWQLCEGSFKPGAITDYVEAGGLGTPIML